jgi:4-hydroxybenzoate polyprenyltransferase
MRIRTKFVALVKATHFPQALAMVLLSIVASALFGQVGIQLLFVAVATAAGQASVGWVNDYVDAQTDIAFNRAHKPSVRYSLEPEALKGPISTALIVLVPFSFLAAGWIGGVAHVLAVASAQIYNLYLSRTVWSWLPYAASFSLLPVFISQSISFDLWPSWQIVGMAVCVGVGAHILNALPDRDLDSRAQLGGLVVSLGKTKSILVFAVIVAVLLALLTWQLLLS